jgi:hypothetical protein
MLSPKAVHLLGDNKSRTTTTTVVTLYSVFSRLAPLSLRSNQHVVAAHAAASGGGPTQPRGAASRTCDGTTSPFILLPPFATRHVGTDVSTVSTPVPAIDSDLAGRCGCGWMRLLQCLVFGPATIREGQTRSSNQRGKCQVHPTTLYQRAHFRSIFVVPSRTFCEVLLLLESEERVARL